MIFWIACALLTLAAVMAILLPFVKAEQRTTEAMAAAGGNDLEVYKDQLREIDEDEGRGLISGVDAEAARTEVSRRILKVAAETPSAPIPTGHTGGRIAVAIVSLGVPLAAWIGYGFTGSPQMPDQPFEARLQKPASQSTIAELIAKTETHLAANPNDGKGWEVIAPIYLRLEKFDQAALAFKRSSELLGSSFQSEVGLAQALTGMNGGKVGPDAEAAFNRANALDPADPQPPFMLATALAQKGQYVDAKAAFERLLVKAPADAPWRAAVERSIAELNVAINAPGGGQGKGPTPADIDNAAAMSDADRMTMIEGMVAGLDAKLKDNPDDKDGWLRLIRSYAMLKKREDAVSALQRARAGLADNTQGLSEVKALAVELGLEAS
jgi:cytochrome c-type biogenesis protein CcmH